MNCIELYMRHVHERPSDTALWMPDAGTVSFAELHQLASRVQRLMREVGVNPGSSILLLDGLGPRLYATIVASLAMGVTVVLVEPWMPVAQLERVVDAMAPRAFLTSWFGVPWGVRVPAIRRIPRWRRLEAVARQAPAPELHVQDVAAETPGLIVFTSGTTGKPKGVVRGQGYLQKQYEVLRDVLGLSEKTGADLCIFANFALVNLAAGRASLVLPPRWSHRDLRRIDALPAHLQPATLTCGPAFLRLVLRHARLSRLRSVHVGGAQTDVRIFEQGFRKWPAAHWMHLYGSSEAEPVAVADARDAVRESKARGLMQTLFLGKPVAAIRAQIEPDTVWVTGPHVCPMYAGNPEENARNKRRDADGTVWHDMGDRVHVHDGAWWYAGRSHQPAEDFALEQQVYRVLDSSASFIHRDSVRGSTYLVGEGLDRHRRVLLARFREIDRTVTCNIVRDRRHRARVDRVRTLAKGAPWLLG